MLTALLSLFIVSLFAYANLLCVAGGAAFDVCAHRDADSDCADVETTHHNEAPAHPSKDCSKDLCFCITMNTASTQPTITQPNHTSSRRVVDFATLYFPDVMPALTEATAYEHAPPGLSPPEFLLISSLSPRSPPVLA